MEEIIRRAKRKIGDYCLYNKQPNAISYGHLYTKQFNLEFSPFKERTVRIFVPQDYDPKKEYPAMVFLDGQNMVDEYTTAYGEWNIDEEMEKYVKEGHEGFIMIGIDCAPDYYVRCQEYNFNDAKLKLIYRRKKYKPYGKVFGEWIVNTLLPDVKKHFSISTNIAVGGSSMGGIYATYLGLTYPKLFRFILAFSPAYIFHRKASFIKWTRKCYESSKRHPKIYIFSGAGDRLERKIFKASRWYYNVLINQFDYEDKVKFDFDLFLIHHEKSWNKHFLMAIKYWL